MEDRLELLQEIVPQAPVDLLRHVAADESIDLERGIDQLLEACKSTDGMASNSISQTPLHPALKGEDVTVPFVQRLSAVLWDCIPELQSSKLVPLVFEAMQLLKTILSKVVQHPLDEKYRRIRIDKLEPKLLGLSPLCAFSGLDADELKSSPLFPVLLDEVRSRWRILLEPLGAFTARLDGETPYCDAPVEPTHILIGCTDIQQLSLCEAILSRLLHRFDSSIAPPVSVQANPPMSSDEYKEPWQNDPLYMTTRDFKRRKVEPPKPLSVQRSSTKLTREEMARVAENRLRGIKPDSSNSVRRGRETNWVAWRKSKFVP